MNMLAEAQQYGHRIAEMLAATDFSPEQKTAWAALVPAMTLEQLKRFDALLRLNMREQVEVEFEDTLTAVKAIVDKHEIAVGAAKVKRDQELGAIEEQFKALEAAAQGAA